MQICSRAIRNSICLLASVGFLANATASVTYLIGNGGLEQFNVSIDGQTISGALAGGISLTETAGDGSLPSSYISVCTDIGGTLYLGNAYTYDTPVTPFLGQAGIAPSWGDGSNDGSGAKAIQNAAYLFYNYGQLTSQGLGGTTTQKAALQLAIWAALYDTTASGQVNGSRFTFSGADATAVADAQAWLAGLNGSYSYTGFLLTPDPLNQGNYDGAPPQELLIAPVPEAPTVIAAALLFLPFATRTLRVRLRRQEIDPKLA